MYCRINVHLIYLTALTFLVAGCNLPSNGGNSLASPSSIKSASASTDGSDVESSDPAMEAIKKFAPPSEEPRRVLFDDSVSDTKDRVVRLEQSVQTLRDEFDAAKPAVARLITIDRDIEQLLNQLEALLSGESAGYPQEGDAYNQGAYPENMPPPTVAAAAPVENVEATASEEEAIPPQVNVSPKEQEITTFDIRKQRAEGTLAALPPPVLPKQDVVAPPSAQSASLATPPIAAPVATPAPLVNSGGLVIQEIRLGAHPDKTRIVFDLSDNPVYDIQFLEVTKQLVVTLKGAKVAAGQPRIKTLSLGLLRGYELMEQGEDQLAIFLFTGAAKVKQTQLLSPKDGKDYRLIIDLGL